MNSKDHTTLVAAVKAAGLVDTLKGPGPFTVFAPTNAAFAALPAGTVDTLLKPENKAQLTKVLTYHVVPGKMDSAALMKAIDAGGGKATLKTVQGDAYAARSGKLMSSTTGRHGHGDHRRRDPVERRDPRRRQGAAAEVSRPAGRSLAAQPGATAAVSVSAPIGGADSGSPWLGSSFNSRSSASRFMTMTLIRRFIGCSGCAGTNSLLEARPWTSSIRSSGRPPATISRRDEFARSLDSSQLL